MELDEKFWDDRYASNQAGWDIGTVSTPLKAYFDQLEDKNSAILIPGCGNAHEAAYLLENGFTNITLLDIAPSLVKRVEEKLGAYIGKQLKLVCANFFDHTGNYDLVVEQTFFCAIDPALRKYYTDKVYDNLNTGGKLVGVLFDRSFEGGPPFGGSKAEYEKLFSLFFEIHTMAPCYNSIEPRKGTELFINLRKRA